MGAWDKGRCKFILCKHCSNRNSIRKTLCQGHDIRFYTEVLVSKELSGTPNPSLYLVKYQEYSLLITKFPEFLDVFFGRYVYSAFSLNRLHHNCAGPFGYSPSKRLQVVVWHIFKPFEERLKPLMEPFLPCGSDGCHGAPVEGLEHGYNLKLFQAEIFLGIFSCKLYGSLVGLSP